MRRALALSIIALAAATAGCKKNDYTMYALTSGGHLLSFNGNKPTSIDTDVTLSGFSDSDAMVQIFFRPSNKALYGISDHQILYRIDTGSGSVTAVSSVSFISGTTYANDTGIGDQVGGVDPLDDQLRVFAHDPQSSDSDIDNLNLRVNLDDGTLVADQVPSTTQARTQPLKWNSGDTNDTKSLQLLSIAYSNPYAGAGRTTLYGIEGTTASLVRVGDDGAPSYASVDNGTVYTIGALNASIGAYAALAIEAKNGDAFAALGSGANSLYSIDLGSGAATLIDQIGDGSQSITSLTVQPDN